MTHPLVDQFRFTRHEWLHGLEGVSEEGATRHFGAMNCISWNAGHLAWHEQRYWLELAQGKMIFPELNMIYAFGAPMSTPALQAILKIWHSVTSAADPFLASLTTEGLGLDLLRDGKSVGQTIGSAMLRITYHYWYHIGEIQAIRQMLGDSDLPVYVAELETEAPYRPE
jgi:DinB superfamily